MREYSTAQQVNVASTGNLTDDVVTNGTEHADHVAFSRRAGSRWADVTAGDSPRRCSAVAKGLIAAGIEAGDRVALISRTRYEWTLLDYAIWFAGAATVPVYETSSAEQVEWILADSGARGVITETPEHASRVKEVRDGLPELHHVWSIEGNGIGVLMTLGHDVTDEQLEQRRTSTGPGDLATLIYTSGTTGRPKGCMLTHGNFMFELTVAVEELDELFAPGGDADQPSTPLLPAARTRLRPDHPGRLREDARADGALRRHQAPPRRLRRVPADLHPGRAASLREGVRHGLPAGRRRRPGQALRPGR